MAESQRQADQADEEGKEEGSWAAAFIVFVLIPAAVLWLAFQFDIIKLPEGSPDPPPALAVPAPPKPPDKPKPGAGSTNKKIVWDFLRKNGFSREQAAGISGNIQAESGFRPEVQEYQNGVGYGLGQWSKARRTALERAARERKPPVPVSDLQFQLQYLFDEMHARKTERPEYARFGNEWNMMLNMHTVEDALVAFHHEFEISHLMNAPDPRAAVIKARLPFALEVYNNPGEYP